MKRLAAPVLSAAIIAGVSFATYALVREFVWSEDPISSWALGPMSGAVLGFGVGTESNRLKGRTLWVLDKFELAIGWSAFMVLTYVAFDLIGGGLRTPTQAEVVAVVAAVAFLVGWQIYSRTSSHSVRGQREAERAERLAKMRLQAREEVARLSGESEPSRID